MHLAACSIVLVSFSVLVLAYVSTLLLTFSPSFFNAFLSLFSIIILFSHLDPSSVKLLAVLYLVSSVSDRAYVMRPAANSIDLASFGFTVRSSFVQVERVATRSLSASMH